jgi:hypothetical protein
LIEPDKCDTVVLHSWDKRCPTTSLRKYQSRTLPAPTPFNEWRTTHHLTQDPKLLLRVSEIPYITAAAKGLVDNWNVPSEISSHSSLGHITIDTLERKKQWETASGFKLQDWQI